jgi:SAM-dependent methyltransferase
MNDYDPVADWYDTYARSDRDLAYFERAAADAAAVLDLMAGTGRVALAMATATRGTVTCLDASQRMLRVLRRKAAGRAAVRAVCGDVRALPLEPGFDLVVIPFNSLAEVTDAVQRRKVIEEVRRVLVPGGSFICTLHNPAVRRRTLDGVARTPGQLDVGDGDRLELTLTGSVETGTAVSRQVFVLRDRTGRPLEERTQVVKFALIEREELEAMLIGQGFRMMAACGDYDGTPIDPEHSPFFIWNFRRP